MVYLDNAAATPVSARTAERFAELAFEFHANPESAHAAGKRSLELINQSAEQLKKALSEKENDLEVFFTSSATEAVNSAFSFPEVGSGVIAASPALHPAVEAAAGRSLSRGIRVLKLETSGGIDLDDLAEKIDASVSTVIVEHVQNETGRIQNVAAIGEIVRRRAPNALFIVDTVQSAGKLPIPWSEGGINIAFVGGHKIGAPCGGALVHRLSRSNNQTMSAKFAEHLRGIRYSSHLLGRPDPAVCAILAETLATTVDQGIDEIGKLRSELRFELAELALKSRLDLKFVIPEKRASPFITSFFLPPYQGEILVRMLSDTGVMVSSGSACEAAGGKASGVLRTMGISDKQARTMLRVSFGGTSTQNDVKLLVSALRKAIDSY